MGVMKMPIAADEPDFMTHGVLKYHAFGQEVWTITTTTGARLITLVLLLTGFVASRKLEDMTDVPKTPQSILEYAMEALDKVARGILGGSVRRFVNCIRTIFLSILFYNLSRLSELRAPTGDFGVTFLLGMFTLFIVSYRGIRNRGMGHFTGLFQPMPILFPTNVIGEITNPISMSLHLFADLLSGTIVMGLWYGTMPWPAKVDIPTALYVYCDLPSECIQTYVFCMLTIAYINDRME